MNDTPAFIRQLQKDKQHTEGRRRDPKRSRDGSIGPAEVHVPGGVERKDRWRAGALQRALYAPEEERLARARQLVSLYDGLEDPMVLAGDFNSEPGSAVMELVEEHWTETDKGPDRFTFPSDRPEREIDFILFRPRGRFDVVSVDVLDEPLVSDHRPLFAVLRLSPAETAR